MLGALVLANPLSTGLSPGQLILHFDYALNILCKSDRLQSSVCRLDDSR